MSLVLVILYVISIMVTHDEFNLVSPIHLLSIVLQWPQSINSVHTYSCVYL